MVKTIRKWTIHAIFASLTLSTLAACQTSGAVEKNISVRVESHQSFAINARRLEVIDNWLMPLTPPYVEHELPISPAESVIEWAKQTLAPKGGSGELILNISEASIKQESLPPEEGLLNNLKDNQDTRLRVTIEAQLLWIQPVGNYQGTAKLAAKVTQTLPESATPADYILAKNNLIARAITLIDGQARDEIAKIDGMILP